MPLTLTRLEQRTEETDLTYAGESVHITYYAGRALSITEAQVQAFQDELTAADGDEGRRRLAAFLLRFVDAWDVAEFEDGPIVPLTVDRLAAIEPYFLLALVEAVFTAARDAKPAGTTPSTPTPKPSVASSKPKGVGTSSRKASSHKSSTRRSSHAGRTSPPGS